MAAQRLDAAQLLARFHDYGCPRSAWLIGGEFERAVVRPDGQPIGFAEPDGIEWVLGELQRRDGWLPIREADRLIALQKEGASITLEPGGQVELSGAPHKTLSALADEMNANRRALLALSADQDHVWIACGLTPITPIEHIGLVPKARYEIMQRYLPVHGDLALLMMKGTCSVQANYDFANEADCARKVRLCAGLSALTTALFANSPLLGGKDTGFKSYRGHIWTRTDPARTGFPPGLRADYSRARWVEYLLDAPMMFIRQGEAWVPAHGMPFRRFMEDGVDGQYPTIDDWELHQTSVFPEVRIKRTIEVRGADCVDHEMALAFCALFTGLLYCDGALDEGIALVEELEKHSDHTSRFDAACRSGLSASIGGRQLADWASDLGDIADRGLKACLPEDRDKIDPLLARIEAGRSPADDLLSAWRENPDPHHVIQQVAY